VLRWRTVSPASSRVSYGPTVGNLGNHVDIADSRTDHEVVITGLTPATRYFYSVGSIDGKVEAGNDSTHYFVTAPTVGSDTPIRIWAIGDPGSGSFRQRAVRDAYYGFDNVPTDIVLTLGDNAYDEGTDSEYTNSFFNVYNDLFRHTPVWAARGNHDRKRDVHEMAFTHPTQAEAGGIASGTELYYSFDYGSVHFVCLDSFTPANLDGDAMYAWLEDDLASTTQKWIIAFWHHAPYSRSSSHDSDTEVGQRVTRERANPILERYGIDLQLAGHNHFYSRTYLINNHYGLSESYDPSVHAVDAGDGQPGGNGAYDKGSNPEGAVYVLAGSSGRLGYTPLNHPANFVVIEELGSMVIDIDGDRMDVRMLRSNSTVPDSFTILKTPAANSAPLVDAGTDQTLTLPAAAALDGTVSDDGLPAGSVLTISWSVVSGPGSVSFGDPAAVDTSAQFSAAGSYVLRLSASDSEFTTSDELSVEVNPEPLANTAPIVTGGPDQSTTLGTPVSLKGSVIDDGLPAGSSTTASWTALSGPGVVSFADALSPSTTADFSAAGTYVLRLSATDTELTASDDVTVIVTTSPPANQPPSVSAGDDLSAVVGTAVALNGSVSDDGLPAGASLSISWSVVSGPGTVTFEDAAAAVTTAEFDAVGTYTLRLSTDDSEITASDDVSVTVTAAPPPAPPPVAPPQISGGGGATSALWLFLLGTFLIGRERRAAARKRIAATVPDTSSDIGVAPEK
jgi:hypothetical protein